MTQRYVLGGPIHPLVVALLGTMCTVLLSVQLLITHSVGAGFLVFLGGLFATAGLYIITEMWFMPPDDERWEIYKESLEYDDLVVPWWYRWP